MTPFAVVESRACAGAPTSIAPVASPVDASHIRMRGLKLLEADAIRWPSGEKTTDQVPAPCFRRIVPRRAIACAGKGSPNRSRLAAGCPSPVSAFRCISCAAGNAGDVLLTLSLPGARASDQPKPADMEIKAKSNAGVLFNFVRDV